MFCRFEFMNKGRRNELRELHYQKRLKNYRIKDDSKGNFHAFKTTGKPCSCFVCQQPEHNYNRSIIKQATRTKINTELTYQGEGGEDDKAWEIFCNQMCEETF